MSIPTVRRHCCRHSLFHHIAVGATLGALSGAVFISPERVRGTATQAIIILVRTYIGALTGFLVAEGRRAQGHIEYEGELRGEFPFFQWVYPNRENLPL